MLEGRVARIWVAILALLALPGGARAMSDTIFQLSYGESAKTIPVTVVYPSDYDAEKTYPVILSLPPGAGDAHMVDVAVHNFASQSKPRGYVMLVPEILGPTLEKDGGALVEAIFAWMAANLKFDAERVVLVGQSNGGIGAFYLAIAAPERFCSMVVLPGVYRGPSEDLDRLEGKPVRLLVGEHDGPWTEGAQKMHDKLEEVGALPQLDIFEGQGHVMNFDPEDFFRWIDESCGMGDQ